MNMRKKSGSYGHKKRYDGGQRSGGHGGHNSHRGGGQRKNWNASREKYLAQARDALASGDRVLAESFLQHADHCWRMMMEEGSHRPRPQAQQTDSSPQGQPDGASSDDIGNQALPPFITSGFGQPQAAPAAQNWEERDEE